ncbi:MAG: ATP-dependent RecD-like DNA helicase [Anaerolineae bacterium]|jgi:exodeoxyribonuclease V alpha subunit|nr:ATP-dependent RecD-like DNA helicase [Chloroflexota bacterium]
MRSNNRTPNPPSSQQHPLHLSSAEEPVQGRFVVVRVTFENPENGYAVVQMLPEDADRDATATVTAEGVFGGLSTGACYRIEGAWRVDRRFGPQIHVTSALLETPTTPAAIERYLAGATISGLGPHYAHLIVEHFGDAVLSVLDAGGPGLEEVRGIGPVRAARIRASWAENRAINRLMVQLQGVAGLTPRQAHRIYHELGDQAWELVSSNPYLLAERVKGMGFASCDRIASALGISGSAPPRLQAALLHVLERALNDGHLWTAPQPLIAAAAELAGATANEMEDQLGTLVEQHRIVSRKVSEAETEGIYLQRVAASEERLARRLAQWLATSPISALHLLPAAAQALTRAMGPNLTEEQYGAIEALLMGARLVVLTGGPGTGKTTALRTLILCLEQLHISYALCASTGRAAKQLSSATGRAAATVHRYLGLGTASERPLGEELEHSVLVIDEASMIDLWLMDEIAGRLGQATHLFLVGDIDQLPPVGPGAVLHDLIALDASHPGPALKVVRLEKVFRQEAGEVSLIAANCQRVRQGQRPLPPTRPEADYFEMPRETAQEALELAVDLVCDRLPRYLGVPPEEIQVLVPMHGGDAGVQALNAALQTRLNPRRGRPEVLLGMRAGNLPVMLREGDRVRQTRNDYSKGVFNGDLGIVQRVDVDERTVQVRFDDAIATYAPFELDDLVHCWAMTVHAAQGSQWPAVVSILLTSHYVMLERNILYTALSRAQRLAVLITQEAALQRALRHTTLNTRRTDLTARLSAGLAENPGSTADRPAQ